MSRPIRDYLAELDRLLLADLSEKRQTLAEINDYLLEAKAQEMKRGASSEQAELIAVQRLGPPRDLVRRLGPPRDLVRRLGGGMGVTPLGRSTARRSRPSREGGRRYPPLALFALGVFLAATILPSVLNLPLSNPSQTLEYAPIATDSQDRVPPGGAFGSLGLGSGLGLGRGDLQEELGEGAPGLGARPSTKRCVGNPPRQTEDPLSPPCVAFFEGNNFGDTYQGVAGDQVRVLFYYFGDPDREPNLCGKTFAASEPPPSDPNISNVSGRLYPLGLYEKYFNDRFQTYGRYVRIFMYVSCQSSPEVRRADAEGNHAKIRPFAAVSMVGRFGQEYQTAMAQRGILNFGTSQMVEADFHRSHPKLLWSYIPNIERQVDLYTSYVCKKVVPHPVSFGNPNESGSKRKLGILYMEDAGLPAQSYLGDLVKSKIEACGGDILITRTYPRGGTPENYAAQNMAAFKAEGVTTIIWAGPFEIYQSRAATSLAYTPEVIVLGQWGLGMDKNATAGQADPNFWSHAWAISNYPRIGPLRQETCAQALLEVDPAASESTIIVGCSEQYNHLLQLFVGIQVAGPRLNPDSVDRGYRAIPAVSSHNPRVPACFYDPGDYTCIKDAVAQWWDPSASPSNSYPYIKGCYRLPEQGKRYLVGTWPEGDVLAQKSDSDPCNDVFF